MAAACTNCTDVVVFIPTHRFFSRSGVRLSTKESAWEDLPQHVEPSYFSPTQINSLSAQTIDSDGPDVSSVDTPSPPSPSTTSPGSASQGLRLFHWSGSTTSNEQSSKPGSTTSLAALQQFQYKKDISSFSTKTHISSGETSAPCPSSTDRNPEDMDNLPDSPPSQDSAFFSQSQPSLASCYNEGDSTFSPPPSYQVDAISVRSYKSPYKPSHITHQNFMPH